MKVCLICTEIFAWGKYGGFGRSTRLLGRELTRRGITVTAIVPQRGAQKPIEVLDGFQVLSFPAGRPFRLMELARRCDADVYHSQHPSLITWLAMRAMPDRKHLITFRDPKKVRDWLIEVARPTKDLLTTLLYWAFETLGVSQAVARADGLFVCAPHLDPIVRDLYGSELPLRFLPTPVTMPDRPMRKADRPTACFIGRWDRRKRPDLFLELARKRPDVRFIAVGKSSDSRWDASLRKRYSGLPNLEMPGFLDQFSSDRLSEILEESWILVNTSEREGLPTSFIEALSYRCALLSGVNPEGIAERFGLHVTDGDFARGLETLLAGDAWKAKGEAGWAYVRSKFELQAAVDQHLNVYRQALAHR